MTDPTTLDLGQQALLYLAGELSPQDRSEFESLLESHPEAQEHLIEAVQLQNLLTQKPTVPNRDYRETVRQRVLHPSEFRTFRWGLGLALAASLLITAMNVSRVEPRIELEEDRLPHQLTLDSQVSTEIQSAPEDQDDRIETAEFWAEMSNVEHYHQVAEDETRRRIRSRESGQMMIPMMIGERTAEVP